MALITPVFADAPKNGDDWKWQGVHLKSGKVLYGLVKSEDATSINFAYVLRNPGSPTQVFHTTIKRSEVKFIDPLDPIEEEILAARIEALDRAAENLRMEKLELKPAPWGTSGQCGLSYTSSHFVLVSNASPQIVRRAAFRLEQIYKAYSRYLTPRHRNIPPTRILLYQSLAEYQTALKGQGRNILNPAFYDATRNEILCASELGRLGEELERLRKEHKQLEERLANQEAAWRKDNKGKLPKKLKERLDADRSKIDKVERENDKVFEKATRQLFQTLFHEAFHAYLSNYVYPASEADVPRWLNEGLAQIFETAILDAGELRVGHADADRLAHAKAALNDENIVPLTQLLQSGADQFLVGHANNQSISERHYLTSWALSFYLTFARQKLGSPQMDRYVQSLKRGTDALSAFRELVGQPLPEFEKEFHDYLRRLRPSGSTATLAEENRASDSEPSRQPGRR